MREKLTAIETLIVLILVLALTMAFVSGAESLLGG